MYEQTVKQGPVLMDWTRQKRVKFESDMPEGLLVSELVSEAIHRLDLPQNVPYSAVVDGRKLNQGDSLTEAGITPDDEIMVTPTVSAG